MYLAELRIENFRMFGEGERALVLPLRPGLTALIGENDTGKTAVIDAIRLALGTRDQEVFRVDEDDFHQPSTGGPRCTEIRIRCKFECLTSRDLQAFVEYLTYEDRDGKKVPVLYLNWKASETVKGAGQRRFLRIETRSGQAGDGPQIDPECRSLLCSTYLRPLRDAERAMASGRGSRLSQILQNTREITQCGEDYDPQAGPPSDLSKLSILGIGRLADALLSSHEGIRATRERLNAEFLKPLSFSGSPLEGDISVSTSDGDRSVRLRQLLEKLDLRLRDAIAHDSAPNHGLGSNNLLFMACEMLLLGSEEDASPLLLIEEPEAHLHPQRQLRLMQYLQQRAGEQRPGERPVQIVITTHSPNLASVIDLNNLVLMHGGKAYPLTVGQTRLDEADYEFLRRFLDVTKANLFFARGVLVVEGDAESLLLPTIADLIGRSLTEHGVSIVNVGGTGLRRYARILQRKRPEEDGVVGIPVACVADLDVMPDCAVEITGRVRAGEDWPAIDKRHWRARRDFTAEELQRHREAIQKNTSGQNVETFVADGWTLEYDLAFHGLAREVWTAAHLAKAEERLADGRESRAEVIQHAQHSFGNTFDETVSKEDLAARVYAFILDSNISKPSVAQHLASLLEERQKPNPLPPDVWRTMLPPYLVAAIEHVTRTPSIELVAGKGKASGA